jgi:hypothetical protein
MLFKKCIGIATIIHTPYYIHDCKKSWSIKPNLYSLQRVQIEYPDETELLKEVLDIFDDDIIDTVWTNSIYLMEWYHHIH